MNKHWKYLKYLIRHKYYVFVAGRKLKVSLWRLLIHDWTKFLPCEWFPYVEFFYGTCEYGCCSKQTVAKLCPQAKENFDKAFLHHLHLNKHHWQYWIIFKDDASVNSLEIPYKYLHEMVADWLGAGKAITGKWDDIHRWYNENKTTIIMATDSRLAVEALLRWIKWEEVL